MIITNGKIVTWGPDSQILEGQDLIIKDGLIASIVPSSSYETANEERVDACGQLVMPGNMCAHTHYYGAFSRGWGYPGEPAANFVEILQRLWWRLDKALSPQAVKYSALVCLVDAIKYGTTTLFDHHASPSCIDGSLDIEHDAMVEAGLRGSLCYEVTDRDGPQKALAGIRENARFIERVTKGQADPKLRAHFGLHASLTLSDETLKACIEANPCQAGYHVHAAEGIADEEDALEKYGKRVIARYKALGMLGPKTILAHGVHCNQDEIEMIAESGAWLSHQPRSNMNNAVGVAPIPAMLESGVKVCLGNDGFSNAMWSEMQAAYFIHKDHRQDPRTMGGYDVMKMAIQNNSQLTSETFGGLRIGVIEPGAAADIILVDYQTITPLHAGNLAWHILFGFRDGMVSSTMVDGKWLMRDRRLLTLDEAEIAAKAREIAAETWNSID
ncbi:MAG: putative aminohydrolase SsnA [Anaerolineaceae bacterium]|nr:putative aminohydrolase SsnA [Anaerolineaceae bacterium]